MAELEKYWMPVNQVVWIIHLIWLIPLVILSILYVNRIEYSVITETGEAMPEIYVKKGLLNITRKHVPFRTITNISSRAGPFDRLFGIGTIEIETAGFSGQKSGAFGGPEEKIEGVVFYEEVRDFILTELRRYRTPYTTATEVVQPHEAVQRRTESDAEIIRTLREIRDILKNQQK
ncbi:MAG: PH domain-containing protein [Candidatus Heimdallarchaeota archaeon]